MTLFVTENVLLLIASAESQDFIAALHMNICRSYTSNLFEMYIAEGRREPFNFAVQSSNCILRTPNNKLTSNLCTHM